MNNIRTMLDKEWAEVFKNRFVLFTVVLLPLVFTIMPLVMTYFITKDANPVDSVDMPAQFLAACGPNMSTSDCALMFLTNQFMLMFMMMPLAIPIAIAAYSVVGEKTTRSLEPLLATPISTLEILVGKSLAAIIPAIAATWFCFILFVVVAPWLGLPPAVHAGLLSPTWILAIFVVGPLMAVTAVTAALMVSSRVNDPRAAEQISMVVIVPILGLIFGQVAGLIVLNQALMLGSAVVIAIINVVLFYLAVRLFQRETILTRWK